MIEERRVGRRLEDPASRRRVNEALIGPDANGVDRDRFINTWGAVYRSILDDGPTPR